MSDPTELLRQMAERSERKLRTPKNLAKGSWVDMDDPSVREMVLGEVKELLDELGVVITARDLRYTKTAEDIDWDLAAGEAQDIYATASMGADPARTGMPCAGSTYLTVRRVCVLHLSTELAGPASARVGRFYGSAACGLVGCRELAEFTVTVHA